MGTESQFEWVFLIGAARSGTKFLRDTLAASNDVSCIPYDVGYVWRDGQESFPNDALKPDSATPERVARIRKTLVRLARKNGAEDGQIVIEKTVGNTLRVDFIRECFPEARFIYLERDAFDTIASAYGQWTAPVDRGYLLKKLRYFPVRSWRYGLWFVRNQFSNRSTQAIWGPRFQGIDKVLESEGVLATVVAQYIACRRAARQLLAADDAFAIRYSELETPGSRWHELLSWLKISDPDVVDRQLESKFRSGSGWPGELTDDQQAEVRQAMAERSQDYN